MPRDKPLSDRIAFDITGNGIKHAEISETSIANDDQWITVHGNGPDVKGSHVLLGEGGEVKAGLGGKFTGKHISQVKGKWAQAASAGGGQSSPPKQRGGGGASSSSSIGATQRNPKIPNGQSQLSAPMKILRETYSAYGVENPSYAAARSKLKEYPDTYAGQQEAFKSMTGEERAAYLDGQKYIWIPKSQSTADNGEVVGIKQWLADKTRLKTQEGEATAAQAKQEYDKLAAEAKALGIKTSSTEKNVPALKDKIAAAKAERQTALKTSTPLPQGQKALQKPLTVLSETDDYIEIENPSYKKAREKRSLYPEGPVGEVEYNNSLTETESVALFNKTLKIPKSEVTVENGQIVGAKSIDMSGSMYESDDMGSWQAQLFMGQHTRNPKLPQGQKEFTVPITIERESDKAYMIKENDRTIWLPKSRTTAENGKVVGAEGWLIRQKFYNPPLTYDKGLISFDASASKRHKDSNGYLHIDASNITKEQVAPYYGEEIPHWRELGLEPSKLYYMYRPADELAKAARSFDGMPLLFEHHDTSAARPAKDYVIGSLGTDAEFRAPYLVNSLIITDGEAIEAIERGDYKQLSAAYMYTPVMQGGMYDGEHYDGRMTDIKANHVALVKEGRAGPDVAVADAKPAAM